MLLFRRRRSQFSGCFEYFRAIARNTCATDDDVAFEDLLKLARNNVERQTVIGLTAGIENLAIGLDEYHIKLQNAYYNKKQSMDGKKKVIYLKLLKTFQRVMAYLFIDGQKSLKDSKIVR